HPAYVLLLRPAPELALGVGPRLGPARLAVRAARVALGLGLGLARGGGGGGGGGSGGGRLAGDGTGIGQRLGVGPASVGIIGALGGLAEPVLHDAGGQRQRGAQGSDHDESVHAVLCGPRSRASSRWVSPTGARPLIDLRRIWSRVAEPRLGRRLHPPRSARSSLSSTALTLWGARPPAAAPTTATAARSPAAAAPPTRSRPPTAAPAAPPSRSSPTPAAAARRRASR